jgi:hypothetical protein
MDWQFTISLSTAAIFFLLSYVVKDMPHSITWAGIGAAVLFGLWGIPWVSQRVLLWPGLLIILGFSVIICGGILTFQYWPASRTEPISPDQQLTISLLWHTDFSVGSYKMLQMLDTDL